MTLEEQLFEDLKAGRQVDIERALLIASGCDTEEKISEYKAKLDELERQCKAYAGITGSDKETARVLHEFLWLGKPSRYNGNFLLTDVVDAQMSMQDIGVGNCLGLSSLYAVLGIRNGLELAVLINDKHVILRLIQEDSLIDIDNTGHNGFGIATYGIRDSKYEKLMNKSLLALVAGMYNSRGGIKDKLGKFEEAIENYCRAIEINPDYASAYNNRGVAKVCLGRFKEGIDDYSRAIKINPDYVDVYHNRSFAKEILGDKDGAIRDIMMKIDLLYKKLQNLEERR